jgi:DNA-directed RNA polymerases I, II, and III subunit RPABC2
MDDMDYDDGGHHDMEDEEVPEEEEEMEEELYDNVEDGTQDDTKVAILDESHKLPNANRVTTKYMTKYERARVLGTRALQIRCEYGCLYGVSMGGRLTVSACVCAA